MATGRNNTMRFGIKRLLLAAAAVAVVCALFVAARNQFYADRKPAAIPWRDFSAAKLKELRGRNKPVLVFCRADWDLTPAILDQTVFTDRRVIDAVKQLDYSPLRADFTKPSKEIEGFLRDVGGRPGEATIVVFHGSKDEAPIVLQMKNASTFILTRDLLDAMKPGEKAKSSKRVREELPLSKEQAVEKLSDLRAMLERDDKCCIVSVTFSGGKVGDEHLRLLNALPNLTSLTLSYTKITDDGITSLPTPGGLTEIEIVVPYALADKITDVTAEHISKMPGLKKGAVDQCRDNQ